MAALTEDARSSRLETGVGFLVLAFLFALLLLALGGRLGPAAGTEFRASFAHVDGLGVGADVRIAGVSVGRVTATAVDPRTFLATVRFRLRRGIALPVDTSAAITSEGLLGGEYLSVSPGGAVRDLPPGGTITATQGAISLQALLGQFIGSVTGLMDAVKKSDARRPASGGDGGLGP